MSTSDLAARFDCSASDSFVDDGPFAFAFWEPRRQAQVIAARQKAAIMTRMTLVGDEFAAVVERAPVNDFAHFCLGRALEKTGDRAEARRHLALAANMRPDRADYRIYRDRLRAA